jgi:hypothetical protein
MKRRQANKIIKRSADPRLDLARWGRATFLRALAKADDDVVLAACSRRFSLPFARLAALVDEIKRNTQEQVTA